MPIMKSIPTTSSTATIHYVRGTGGSKPGDRAVYEWAQHTTPDAAINDFRHLREEYGQQGATRLAQGKYVEPDDAADATHIKIGPRYRVAKPGEVATHERLVTGPEKVKRTEALHIIHSFGVHEVNVDDPEQMRLAFEAVKAHYAESYPGFQIYLGAHADAQGSKAARARGEKGKFHVHVVMNAVIYEDQTIDDRLYKRGHRVAGIAANITAMRVRQDQFLTAHGHEFGLPEQQLADPRSPEARAVRKKDHEQPARERGEVTPQELVRGTIEETFADMSKSPQVVAPLEPKDRVKLFASEVEKRGVATVNIRKGGALGSYKPIKGNAIRGQKLGGSLGDRYTDKGVQEQLEDIAQGRWKPLPEPEQLPPREPERLTREELEALVEEINNTPMVLDYKLEQEALERAAAQQAEELAAQAQATQPEQSERQEISEEERPLDPRMAAILAQQDEADRLRGERVDQAIAERERAAIEARVIEPDSTPAVEEERPSFLTPAEDIEPKAAPVASVPSTPATPTSPETPPVAEAPKKPQGPRSLVQVAGFSDTTDKGVDLLAIVAKENDDGGAYVVYEVAHTAPQAHGQTGLNLKAKRVTRGTGKDVKASVQSVTRITANDYTRLKAAAGDQVADIRGAKTFSFAADVELEYGAYVPDHKTAQPSKSRPKLDANLFARQRRSEEAAQKAFAAGDTSKLTREEAGRWRRFERARDTRPDTSKQTPQSRGLGD